MSFQDWSRGECEVMDVLTVYWRPIGSLKCFYFVVDALVVPLNSCKIQAKVWGILIMFECRCSQSRYRKKKSTKPPGDAAILLRSSISVPLFHIISLSPWKTVDVICFYSPGLFETNNTFQLVVLRYPPRGPTLQRSESIPGKAICTVLIVAASSVRRVLFLFRLNLPETPRLLFLDFVLILWFFPVPTERKALMIARCYCSAAIGAWEKKKTALSRMLK